MNALALIVLLPFIGAVAVLATGSRPNLRECLSLGAGITLVGLVVSLLPAVFAGERPVSVLAEPIPGIPIALEAEPLGMLFALIASVLWIVTTKPASFSPLRLFYTPWSLVLRLSGL